MNRREISPEEAESLRLAKQFMNPPKSEHGTRFLGTTQEEVAAALKDIPTDAKLPQSKFGEGDGNDDFLSLVQEELPKHIETDELDGDDDGSNGKDRMAA